MTILYITSIIFILILISFTWYTLDQMESVEKILYIAIGLVFSVIITTTLFNISSKNIDYPVAEMIISIRKMVLFAFVPINAIAFMPFLGRQMSNLKFDQITQVEFAKRLIILLVVLVILGILEHKYLINMQLGILDIINKIS